VDAALNDGNAWARRASVLVVGLAKRTLARNGRDNPNAAHDLGIALGSMLAEATARGLATHPMGGFDATEVRRDFAVPDAFEPRWVLAVGHHAPDLENEALEGREARPRTRRPLAETVFGPAFGKTIRL
jgi:nitroreductase